MHISRLCSCYAPSSSNKGNTEGKGSNRSNNKSHHQHVEDEQVHQGKINGVSSGSRIKMYGADHRGIPIKSNFKKTSVQEDANQISSGIRKVTWSDAHGKSISHVQEFEPSVSDDGELRGVRNSCVCAIL
ncbi:hypothetical protein L1987_04514 [Smallanthus sonchifolius]|uniref:Uncharacterized protein n=1 Tax=Smallanthus sonchifolius TaxID=185202 RepID=A0ACB9JSY1_9ASTR|nr:hypothetical protein L1987_04514 [Smallanthus sonchifolius]